MIKIFQAKIQEHG